MSESAYTNTTSAIVEGMFEKLEELENNINENPKFMYGKDTNNAENLFVGGKNINIHKNIELVEAYNNMSWQDMIICSQGLKQAEQSTEG